MIKTLDELKELYDEAAEGGGEEAVARIRKRGKMPIRERISHVLDQDSPVPRDQPACSLALVLRHRFWLRGRHRRYRGRGMRDLGP